MNDAALRSPVTALSGARLGALEDMWAEMGQFRNDSTTACDGPAIVFPWPILPPPCQSTACAVLELIDEATLG